MFQDEKSAILHLYSIDFKTFFDERIQFLNSETSQMLSTIWTIRGAFSIFYLEMGQILNKFWTIRRAFFNIQPWNKPKCQQNLEKKWGASSIFHLEIQQSFDQISKSEMRFQYSTLKLARNLEIGRPKTLYSNQLDAPMWPNLQETASLKRRKNE